MTENTISDPESLIPKFQLDRILNQGKKGFPTPPKLRLGTPQLTASDQAGRRISLVGNIDGSSALLTVERAPFPNSRDYLAALPSTLSTLKNLGANDIYFWYLGHSSPSSEPATDSSRGEALADLKLNLIYPCTEQHVKKYSRQTVRTVIETPEIYAQQVRPYMQRKREAGRLNWVYNIIDGKTEVEDVIYRSPGSSEDGFLLLPDLNWDRRTEESMHLLALVERRDIWSVRDLRKKHVVWLRRMDTEIKAAVRTKYAGIEADMLKCYVHYQPTYYHFHVHVVHVALEAGATQAVGKAIGLDSVIATLEIMAGDDERGMDAISLSYTLGEQSDLWVEVFAKIKSADRASQ